MLGGLSKMTFAFFAAAAAPILVYARWRRCGIKAIGWAALGGAVFAIPGLLIWMLCGRAMIEFGVRFAFGEAAALWSVPGMGAARYLTRFLGSLDLALFPIAILALLFARGVWKEKARLIPVGIVLGYLLVAAMGQNHEPRYTLTVAVSLPLVLSWHGIARRPKPRLDAAPFLGAAFVALLLSVPMIARPQLAAVRHDLELLRGFSHGQPTSFLIATDGPDNNIEVLQLARQIGGRQLLPVYVDTLVYDAINKRSLNDGYTRMAAADYVLFLRPHLPPGPPWSRQWASEYRAYAEETGALIPFPECPDFDVFRMKPR